MKNKTSKRPGLTITVSPEAHEKIRREAFDAKPRLSMRELMNIKTKLPKEL